MRIKMTKHIHVINADTSSWKVKVLVQDKWFKFDEGGKVLPWDNTWKTVEIIALNNPGQLLTKYITDSRRLVIEEDGMNT